MLGTYGQSCPLPQSNENGRNRNDLCRIGADGALTVSFDIESDNNVSWLAIKNVRYFDPNATAIKTVNVANGNGDIFNLQGQKVNKASKGLYIQDGKIILKK